MVRFQLNALFLSAIAATHQWTCAVASAAEGDHHHRAALLREDAPLVKRKLATKSTKAPVPTEPTEPTPTKAPKSTKAPTPSPTMYYCSADHILSVLGTYSDPVDLATVGSSQYLAAQWILEDNICPDAVNFKQRYAFVVGVYAGLADPYWVGYYVDESNWINHETHECEWSEWSPCNDNLELDLVDYWKKDMTGTIPTEIGLLTATTYLDYSSNSALHGTIPTELARLTLLEQVDMYYNDEGSLGTLPGEVLAGWAGSLTHLDLDSAGLTGTIPTEIGLCTNLDTLYLDDNDFTGGVPTQMGSLDLLETLWLYGNSLLTGAVPSDLCDTLTNAQVDCAVTCSCGAACSCT